MNFKKKFRSQKGASFVETTLMVTLIAVASISSLNYLAQNVGETFCAAGDMFVNYRGYERVNNHPFINGNCTWGDEETTGGQTTSGSGGTGSSGGGAGTEECVPTPISPVCGD